MESEINTNEIVQESYRITLQQFFLFLKGFPTNKVDFNILFSKTLLVLNKNCKLLNIFFILFNTIYVVLANFKDLTLFYNVYIQHQTDIRIKEVKFSNMPKN